jgi:hypothetical protein
VGAERTNWRTEQLRAARDSLRAEPNIPEAPDRR